MYSHERLKKFTHNILLKIGCSEEHAELASSVLISADLRGIDSHGVARLSGYVRLWEAGRVNATPDIKVVHETPSTAVIDGDAGMGLVVAPFAMEIAMKKAEEVGTGWISVKNSNHFGIGAYHSMMALEKDMIGLSMTNASPLVAPTFSKDRMLGTNPISFSIPAGKETPIIMDMATTTAANGKLEMLQRKGEEAPLSWIQDAEGEQTTDPSGVKNGGALLPLGASREGGSHKGYGLGAIVDIFSAVLSGANYGPWVPPFVSFLEPRADLVGEGIGHFLGAMRVDAFRPKEEYYEHIDNWIRTFRASAPTKDHDKVLIPGDPERETEKERRSNGIELLEKIEKDLQELGEKFGVEL